MKLLLSKHAQVDWDTHWAKVETSYKQLHVALCFVPAHFKEFCVKKNTNTNFTHGFTAVPLLWEPQRTSPVEATWRKVMPSAHFLLSQAILSLSGLSLRQLMLSASSFIWGCHMWCKIWDITSWWPSGFFTGDVGVSHFVSHCCPIILLSSFCLFVCVCVCVCVYMNSWTKINSA